MDNKVFINCPYDDDYSNFFRIIIFFCYYFNCEPHFASETSDASSRIGRIIKLIKNCNYSIHDISRVSISSMTSLPRFNMPFELGLDIMCRDGTGLDNKILILDGHDRDYEKCLSDLKGSDILAHSNNEEKLANLLRTFFVTKLGLSKVDSTIKILNEFKFAFTTWLYEENKKRGFREEDILEMSEFKLKVNQFFNEEQSIIRPDISGS